MGGKGQWRCRWRSGLTGCGGGEGGRLECSGNKSDDEVVDMGTACAPAAAASVAD